MVVFLGVTGHHLAVATACTDVADTTSFVLAPKAVATGQVARSRTAA